jgi:hypothetical protein
MPCEKVFNGCRWCGLRFLPGKTAWVSDNYLCKNNYCPFPTQISFQLIQQPVYLGLVFFTGPLYIQMGTDLMTQLPFASPLPLFLSPTNFKFSVQDYIEESREFQNREYTEMTIWQLSHHQTYITLYLLIILTLYFIGEV